MSKLAVQLYKERGKSGRKVPVMDDYLPLLNAVFGMGEYDPTLNGNAKFQIEVEHALMKLGDNNPYGLLQQYFVEEYFLQGKSKEEIGQEIVRHIDLLLSDLESSALLFLRHPDRSRPLLPYIRKEQNDG